MKPASAPADAFALIVGIERSLVFDGDPLVGPVRNALAAADWCLKQGVPPARVQLFVSAKPQTQPMLDDWCAAHGGIVVADACEETIREFLVLRLPELAQGGLLLMFWSGHGQIDQRCAHARRLFYEDSSQKLPRNLDVVAILQALRGRSYAGFPKQVFVLDTCANFTFGLRGNVGLLPPTGLVAEPAVATTRQWVGLAAAPGQYATNEATDGALDASAKFTTRLLDELGTDASAPWPDFAKAFERTRERFRFDENQTPVNWVHGPGDVELSDDGLQPLSTVEATQLLAAVERASLEDAQVAACASAALGDTPSGTWHVKALASGPAAIVQLLADSACSGVGLPVLQRFAEQVARCAPGNAAPLRAWLAHHAEPQTLAEYRRQLDAAAVHAPDEICFVLVDERSDDADDLVQFDGFLFVGADPAPVRLLHDGEPVGIGDEQRRADIFGEILERAHKEAAARGVTAPRFVVEIALPVERIDADLTSLSFINDRRRWRPVAQHYPVVRRLADRLRALARVGQQQSTRALGELAAWRDVARQMRQRVDASGLRVVWLRPGDRFDGRAAPHLARDPAGSCLGFDAECGVLRDDVKDGFYDHGLPFACWTTNAWTAADKQRLRRDMARTVGTAVLRRVYELCAEDDHPASRLSILWDDPARDPYIDKLG